MRKEDKELLLKDLCSRLPYGVKIQVKEEWATLDTELKVGHINRLQNDDIELKPYLRPMSSMTEEEHTDFFNYHYNIGLEEIKKSGNYLKAAYLSDSAKFDWLNKHHFDYRYFIERDLAIAVTKENNPYED